MLFLIQKEFKQILRNKFLPKLVCVFPIMVILVMPWVANMEIKNVNLAILDWDKSSLSQSLTTKINASPFFRITLYPSSIQEAYECIYRNDCDIIIEFLAGFEDNALKSNHTTLGIYANTMSNTKGTLGTGYLNQIIMDFTKEKSIAMPSSFTHFELFNLYAFNPNLDYKIYMIPALVVMVLTMICGFLPAFNIIGEKEKGNIDQINVTPIPKSTFILSKIIPYWVIGLFVLSVCFLLAFLVYGLLPRGNFLLIYVFAIAYILVVTGMGLVISNYSHTMQQAMFVSYFFILILILLSGLFTSVKSMPFFAQCLTYLNPLKYFIESIRSIYLKGSGFEVLWLNLLILLVFAFVLNIWAILSYKKRE